MHIVLHSMGLPFDGDTVKNQSLGGSESAAYYLALELQKRGHRVDVWTTKEGCDGFYDGVRYTWVGAITPEKPLGVRFEQYVEFTPHDVLIVQRHPGAFHRKYAAKLCIWQLHDLALHRYSAVTTHGLWQMDAITGVSQWHVEQIKEVYGYKPERIHAIPNGIDPALYVRTDAKEGELLAQIEASNDFKMLYQSRPERGLENLVKPGGIMDRLLATDAHLYVCGYDNTTPEMQGYYAQLQKWASDLPNVTLLGSLSKAQLAQVQMRCDLLCYPTVFEEVSCITAMEAMAAGLPMLSCKVGALPETCDGSGTMLVDTISGAVDGDRFVDLITDWSENPTAIDGMRRQQLRAAKKKTWEYAAGRLDALIEDLFAKRRSSLARNLRHCIEHSDIGFAHWLLGEGNVEVPQDAILEDTIREVTTMYDFADDGPKLKAHYEKYQGKYYDEFESMVIGEDVSNSTRFRGTFAALAQAANARPGKSLKVLDYGCAHGHYLVPFAKVFPKFDFVGVDISSRAIAAALKWVQRDKVGNVTLINGAQDALEPAVLCDNFSQANGTMGAVRSLRTDKHGELVNPEYDLFDVIIAGEVVEHAYNYHALLEKFRKLLKPDGLLIVTTPAGRWEWSGREAFRSGREHLHHFERADIEEICTGKEVDIMFAPNHTPDQGGLFLGSWIWSVRNNGEPFRHVDYERKLKYLAPRELVSACMIVKDGEATLKQCVDSFADYVDELVIAVDPATTDDTPAIIERIKLKYPWLTVTLPPGKKALVEGFAAARNVTVDAASGDWIMWCDADEQMRNPQFMHRLLRQSGCDGHALAQIHYATDPPAVVGTDYPTRLFRKDCGARFHGFVHEHPEVVVGEGVKFSYARPDMAFLHTGYVDEQTRRKRFQRNYPLLQRDVKENPDRKLNAYLMLRDIAQSLIFEQQQAQGNVLEGHAERAKEGVALFERIMGFNQIKMIMDCMPYYSHCCQTLGTGFDIELKFRISHPQARDLSVAGELTGRVLSRDHYNKLLALISQESTKHYDSKHL